MTNEEYAAHAAARLPFAIRPASDYRVGDRVRFLWAFAEDGESRAHEGLIASVSEEGEGPCKGVSPTVTVTAEGRLSPTRETRP